MIIEISKDLIRLLLGLVLQQLLLLLVLILLLAIMRVQLHYLQLLLDTALVLIAASVVLALVIGKWGE